MNEEELYAENLGVEDFNCKKIYAIYVENEISCDCCNKKKKCVCMSYICGHTGPICADCLDSFSKLLK